MQMFIFFFNDTATTEIYTLSLHDALPISSVCRMTFPILASLLVRLVVLLPFQLHRLSDRKSGSAGMPRPISYAVFCLKKKRRFSQVVESVQHSPRIVPADRHVTEQLAELS